MQQILLNLHTVWHDIELLELILTLLQQIPNSNRSHNWSSPLFMDWLQSIVCFCRYSSSYSPSFHVILVFACLSVNPYSDDCYTWYLWTGTAHYSSLNYIIIYPHSTKKTLLAFWALCSPYTFANSKLTKLIISIKFTNRKTYFFSNRFYNPFSSLYKTKFTYKQFKDFENQKKRM